jgi:hypothetical protein
MKLYKTWLSLAFISHIAGLLKQCQIHGKRQILKLYFDYFGNINQQMMDYQILHFLFFYNVACIKVIVVATVCFSGSCSRIK